MLDALEVVHDPEIKLIVVDLGESKILGSGELGALCNCHGVASEQNVRIALVNVNQGILAILQITRLDSLFEVYDSVDAAIGAI